MLFGKFHFSEKKMAMTDRFINIYRSNRKHESIITSVKNAYRNSKMIEASLKRGESRN